MSEQGAVEVVSYIVDQMLELVEPTKRIKFLALVQSLIHEIDTETLKIWTDKPNLREEKQ